MSAISPGEANLLRHDISKAERAVLRPPRMRQITEGRVRYAAFDAHQLLEQLSEAERARPGHPLG